MNICTCKEKYKVGSAKLSCSVHGTKVSQLVPKHRWDLTKVASCMGQFLQAHKLINNSW